MLKAIHAQESKNASREKARAVVAEQRAMKLREAAKKAEDGIEETLTYCDFPSWRRSGTTPSLPADFTQPEPANKFAHKS